MVDFGASNIKSLVFSLTSPATATSGNIVTDFDPCAITGRVIGLEVGSPAFDAATGSVWVVASGATFQQNREVVRVNGVAQERTYYPTVQYQRDSANGAVISGLGGCKTEYPALEGEQLAVRASGCYNGTSVKVVLHWQ